MRCTSTFASAAAPCHRPRARTSQVDFWCPIGLEETLGWTFSTISALASGKRLALVGLANGGVIAQWYIDSQVQPAPEKLVLISQPTNPVWARILGNPAVMHKARCSDTSDSLMAQIATAVEMPVQSCLEGVSMGLCDSPGADSLCPKSCGFCPQWDGGTCSNATHTQLVGGMGGVTHHRGLIAEFVATQSGKRKFLSYGDAQMDRLYKDWLSSPNFAKQQTWWEETVMQHLYDGCASAGRPPVPHLILYGRSAAGRYAWPEMQEPARMDCDADPNCAGVRYVALPDTPEPPVQSNFAVWGEWAHVENPVGVRAEIEDFLLGR
jgi:hypothetical protein